LINPDQESIFDGISESLNPSGIVSFMY